MGLITAISRTGLPVRCAVRGRRVRCRVRRCSDDHPPTIPARLCSSEGGFVFGCRNVRSSARPVLSGVVQRRKPVFEVRDGYAGCNVHVRPTQSRSSQTRRWVVEAPAASPSSVWKFDRRARVRFQFAWQVPSRPCFWRVLEGAGCGGSGSAPAAPRFVVSSLAKPGRRAVWLLFCSAKFTVRQPLPL